MSIISSCLEEAPKQSIPRRTLQSVLTKGLDEHEKKCVDEEFDINISQRGKGIIGAYEDHDAMTNGTRLETKSVLRNLFDCSALEKYVKFVLNNAEMTSWGAKTIMFVDAETTVIFPKLIRNQGIVDVHKDYEMDFSNEIKIG